MPPPHLRLTHALRTALGGIIISLISLKTPLTSGCTTSILFFISTIAGTSSNYQGPQLRSTSLAALGAFLGAILHAVVRLITASSLPTFFLALPVLLALSALRADQSLMPLPAVANVFFGFLLISKQGKRTQLDDVMAAFAVDVCLAWLVANAVNLPFPDRAGEEGRKILADVVTEMGFAISRVTSTVFANGEMAQGKELHFSVFAETEEINDFVQIPSGRERKITHNAKDYLRYMDALHPSGVSRVAEYESLAKAVKFFEASRYEPRVLPETKARWRNVKVWGEVVHQVKAMLNKVSSLESVVGTGRFDCAALRAFFGEAYLPMWKVHLAVCAAACQKMGCVMKNDTCTGVTVFFDADEWRRRRSDMYFGFLVRYRLGLRGVARRIGNEMLNEKDEKEGIMDLRTLGEKCQAAEIRGLCKKGGTRMENQALSFFALTAQALSEEIAHVQLSIQELAKSSDVRGPLSPFFFLVSAFPALWKRVVVIVRGDMNAWEVRFAFTHAMLLASILGLSLLLPIIQKFEASEIAWVFTSAALAAQLSAEPTVFIGAIRVGATIIGALLAFGFNSILDVLDRASNPDVQYLIAPYNFVVTVGCLMLVPVRFRYAAFLLIVTNSIVLFCPRSTVECSVVLMQQSSDCFPNWKYVLSRTANVSIGVVFAVLFHLLFWPRYANQVALRQLSTSYLNSSRLFGKLHRKYFAFGSKDNRGATIGKKVKKKEQREVPVTKREAVIVGDVYRKELVLLANIQESIGNPLSAAMLSVQAASVWQRGPLKVYPLIPRVLPDFVALTVSLAEMASILGRRPIFSKCYGRSVFQHYISPMLHVYQTIQVSLHNLVGISLRAINEKREHNLRGSRSDLRQAIGHLARTVGELRQDVERRSHVFRKSSAMALARRKPCRFTAVGDAADEVFADMVFEDIGISSPLSIKQERSQSFNDLAGTGLQSGGGLCVDDVVLYDAFSFIADSCLSAFIRIAIAVLSETETKLDELEKKRR